MGSRKRGGRERGRGGEEGVDSGKRGENMKEERSEGCYWSDDIPHLLSCTNTTYLLGLHLSLSCSGTYGLPPQEWPQTGQGGEGEREEEQSSLTRYSLKWVLLKARKCGLLFPPLVSKQ